MGGDVVGDVVVDQRRAVRDRLLQVELDGKRFVVDLDRRAGVPGGIAVDGDHHGDALAGVEHVVARERPRGLVGGERRHRLLDGLRRDVVEQRGLHSAAASAVSAHQPASGSCQPSGQSSLPASRAAST